MPVSHGLLSRVRVVTWHVWCSWLFGVRGPLAMASDVVLKPPRTRLLAGALLFFLFAFLLTRGVCRHNVGRWLIRHGSPRVMKPRNLISYILRTSSINLAAHSKGLAKHYTSDDTQAVSSGFMASQAPLCNSGSGRPCTLQLWPQGVITVRPDVPTCSTCSQTVSRA